MNMTATMPIAMGQRSHVIKLPSSDRFEGVAVMKWFLSFDIEPVIESVIEDCAR